MFLIHYFPLQISYSHGSEYGKPIHNLDQFSDQTVQIAAIFGAVLMAVTAYAWWKQRNKKRGS